MVKNPMFIDVTCHPRYLQMSQQQFIAASKLYIQPDPFHGFNDGQGISSVVHQRTLPAGGNKSKIDVPQVMKNSSAPGDAPGHNYPLLVYIGVVNLRQGILVLPHHNGRVVPVQKEIILPALLQQNLLGGQVEKRVGIFTDNTTHEKGSG